MDRNIVYPGSIPLDTDILAFNRNVMTALGYLAQAVFGSSPIVDGLNCTATTPPSMNVFVGPGMITQLTVLDQFSYGSLPGNTSSPLLKMGIAKNSAPFTLVAPTVSGQVNSYLIQATFQEIDSSPVVLPYYNASNPSQPYNGPANAGTSQPTIRSQNVQLQLKLATSSNASQATPPPVDAGWIGLYTIQVAYGQTAIQNTGILTLPTAPFVYSRLQNLRSGFGSGCQTFTTPGTFTFTVPAGVQQVEVEVWGGGSGTFASLPGRPSGGGSGGGYARERITQLTPGQSIPVVVGAGGAGGVVSAQGATAGGTSSFGSYVNASGGSLNPFATMTDPGNGATPAGTGNGGDVNLRGSAGQAGILNQGGMGGGAPMGGSQNSGTSGVSGVFPGGGASGAGTGADSATPYNGASGAAGMVVVRW